MSHETEKIARLWRYADDCLAAHPFGVRRYPIYTRESLKHSLRGFRAAVGRNEYTLDEILSITERFKKKQDEFAAEDLKLAEMSRNDDAPKYDYVEIVTDQHGRAVIFVDGVRHQMFPLSSRRFIAVHDDDF